jgi:hypothetical protein
MGVTLAEAVTQVRDLLDEPTAQFWSTTQLETWINQGVRDVARKAEILWNTHAFTVTVGVQNYPFPSDFLNCHRAEFKLNNGDQVYGLTYRGYNAMDDVWGILQSIPAAYPSYFTIWGNKVTGRYIRLYPSPAATGTITIYYYRDSVTATSTETIDTLPGWEDVVYHYAVWKAKRKDRGDPSWQEDYSIYLAMLQEQINRTRSFTDLGEQVSSGNPNWPLYAYVDGPWFT